MSSFILDIQIQQPNDNINQKSFSLEYNSSAKFQNDKVNFENDDFYLLLDGIVLNKKLLLESNKQKSWADYLIESFQKQGNQFFKHLKGSYYGFLFDKKKKNGLSLPTTSAVNQCTTLNMTSTLCFQTTILAWSII